MENQIKVYIGSNLKTDLDPCSPNYGDDYYQHEIGDKHHIFRVVRRESTTYFIGETTVHGQSINNVTAYNEGSYKIIKILGNHVNMIPAVK